MNAVVINQRIWDLPIRLFHWLLVIGVALQFGTAEFGWLSMQWHIWIGYGLLVLLLFRLGWGVFGSDSARFGRFVSAPGKVLGYLRQWSATPMSHFAGHNPAGGWATLLMLLLLLLQALSGLATSDDIEWFGPLCNKLPEAWIAIASWLHRQLQTVLLAVLALHMFAIVGYRLFKGENLIGAMWHGRRAIAVDAPRLIGNGRALALLGVAALLVAGLVWWTE